MTVESADQLPNTMPPKSHLQSQLHHYHSSDHAPYPKLHSNDVASPHYASPESIRSATDTCFPASGGSATKMPKDSHPYVSSLPAPNSSANITLGSVKVVLGKWRKKAAEATKKTQDYAENTWQHLRTGPSVAEAAVGRIAQGTKVLAEVKLAFCRDNPLSYKMGEQTKWSYFKVIIPPHQLKAVNPSRSTLKPEKYIQLISVDDYEFWFMGFLQYDGAVWNILGAMQPR